MTDTRQALLPCPFCGNSKGLAVANENPQDLSGGYFIACPSCDASTGLRFACGEDPIPLLIEQWNRRAALSAQPVAGADAESKAMFVARLENMREHGDTWLTIPAVLALLNDCDMLASQAAPAPEPSVQAVAHPSHQTVREWMPVSEALRLSDLWTAGDLDNCGQWRAAIKVLADEVRALAASPQPEPSAQGEPVAWVEPACHGNGGCCPDDKCEKWTPLASAPSTPPPAVVEAVPLTERWVVVCESVLDVGFGGDVREGGRPELGYALLANATTFDSEDKAKAAIRNAKLPIGWVYMPLSRLLPDLRGIAPKAAQEKT